MTVVDYHRLLCGPVWLVGGDGDWAVPRPRDDGAAAGPLGDGNSRSREGPRFAAQTLAVGLGVLLLVLSGCTVSSASDGQAGDGSDTGFVTGKSLTRVPPEERSRAPMLTGPAVEGDKTISTADYPGKIIVINVWGSWCAPCRKEAPDLAQASRDTKEIAQFIGLNVRDQDKAQAQAFDRVFKMPYPSIYDPDGSMLVRFSGELPPNAIPTTLIIDRKGRIAIRVIGIITRKSLVDMINAVDAGK